MAFSAEVRVKKQCCKDRPRCKKCPVTCKRLLKAGKAERLSKRRYLLVDVSKSDFRAARAR